MGEPHDLTTVLIANERTKVAATYVMDVAIAVLAVGGLASLFSQRAASAAPPDRPWLTPVLSLLCICVSAVLHRAGRGFLRDLQSWMPTP